MAHFAKVVDGIVVTVIVAEQDYIDSMIDDSPGRWIQTSYNTKGGIHYTPQEDGVKVKSKDQSKALRKNYAGIGFIYDVEKDAFYEPQPYPSWVFNNDSCMWEPPVAFPEDGKTYDWDESSKGWRQSDG